MPVATRVPRRKWVFPASKWVQPMVSTVIEVVLRLAGYRDEVCIVGKENPMGGPWVHVDEG